MVELIGPDLKKLAQSQRKRGEFEDAVKTLQQAIVRAGVELADLHGILGGTRKDQGDLVSAAAEYDEGFRIESHYGIASSYNALNRLILRIMLVPGSLTDPDRLRKEERLEFVNVRNELLQLQAQLERQIEEERASDFWAAGDLLVSAALNGDIEMATVAVQRFVACSPPKFAYSSYHKTIASLAQLDTPSRDYLEKVDALLAASQEQVR